MINKGDIATFIDDILVGTEAEKGHNKLVEEILKRLEEHDLCHDSKSNLRLSPAFKGLLNNLRNYNTSQSISSTGQVTILCK